METKKCPKCQEIKNVEEFNKNKNNKRYLDCYCKKCHNKRMNIYRNKKLNKKEVKEFESLILKTDNCWIWKGNIKITKNITIPTFKGKYATKISYEINFGKIPNGYHIRRKCGNLLCINPKHLCLEKNKKGNIENLLLNTPEAYYWIGFIMADGYFNHNINTFSMNLSDFDENHMKKFSKFVSIPYFYRNGYRKNQRFVCITKTDKNTIPKIIKKFNFNPRKTYNPPNDLNIENEDLFIAFIIGYIDGDGSIAKKTGSIRIACHFSWLNCVDKWFKIIHKKINKDEVFKINEPKAYIDKRNKTIIQISNNKFVYYLKQKSIELNLPTLKRKWNRIKLNKRIEKTQSNIKKIIENLNKNKSAKETSEILNLYYRYVSDIQTKYCPEIFSNKKIRIKKTIERIKKELKRGMDKRKISNKYKFSISYIEKIQKLI